MSGSTGANLLKRTFIAPYFVNYHLEPHLLFYVPWLHAILRSGSRAARMEVQRGYLSVLRLATAKPDADDRRGDIVSHARRRRVGGQMGEDQGSSGF